MTKIKEIRNILNGTISLDKNNGVEVMVTNISQVKATDEQLLDYMTKKNIDFEEMKVYAKNLVKKANRTKHTFSTLDELNNFTAENECGNSWIDGDNYSVYKY